MLTGVRDFQSKGAPAIQAALKALGVKDAEQWAGKISFIVNQLVAAARIIESRLIN